MNLAGRHEDVYLYRNPDMMHVDWSAKIPASKLDKFSFHGGDHGKFNYEQNRMIRISSCAVSNFGYRHDKRAKEKLFPNTDTYSMT